MSEKSTTPIVYYFMHKADPQSRQASCTRLVFYLGVVAKTESPALDTSKLRADIRLSSLVAVW